MFTRLPLIVHHSYPPTPVTRQVRAGTLLALKRVSEPATCEVTKKVPSWSGLGFGLGLGYRRARARGS